MDNHTIFVLYDLSSTSLYTKND